MMLSLRLPLAAVLLVGTVALAPAAVAAQAGGPYSGGPGPAHGAARMARLASLRMQDGREASATVLASIDKLFEFAGAADRPNKLQAAAFLDREIAPYFDFGYMAAFVAGPSWEDLSPKEREALAAQLESRILSGVAERLLTPPGQHVRYVRPRPGKHESVDVRVSLSSPPGLRGPRRGVQQPLVFRMYRTDDGWKVFDMLVDGRSILGSYRNSFGSAGDGAGALPPGPMFPR